jgi:hypothetical protein
MRSRTAARVCLACLLVGSLVVVGQAYATRSPAVTAEGPETTAAAPREGMTVVATDSNTWLGQASDGPRANAELLAVAPDGSVAYHDDSHTRYWDVDPVPNTTRTVEYVYADHLNASECGGETVCTRNGIERVNLSTGEVTPVYSRLTPGKHSSRWHDADRRSPTRYVVADIAQDRVVVVNTTTGVVEWAWDAQSAYDTRTTGGPYPEDWTHLNDVEVLPDGRIQVSLRNHDRVVYLDRETGLLENRTLGNGSHDVLYEQHNPDYLANGTGPPSTLVADSENNRVVEYRRTDDGWQRSWTWSDDRLQWPRDADRLPNGHTLVTDSNGDRVVEVDEDGTVVWSLPVAFPYEAERLGTGDESTGGPPTGEAGLAGRVGDEGADESTDAAESESDDSLAGPLANSVFYVLPAWMGLPATIATVLAVPVTLGWLLAEWRWSRYRLSVRSPVSLGRDDP